MVMARKCCLPRNRRNSGDTKVLHVNKNMLVAVNVSREDVPFVQHHVAVRSGLSHFHRSWRWREELGLVCELFGLRGVEYYWQHDCCRWWSVRCVRWVGCVRYEV